MRDLLVNHEKIVKFLNFICAIKIKLWRKFSSICQVNPLFRWWFLTHRPKWRIFGRSIDRDTNTALWAPMKFHLSASFFSFFFLIFLKLSFISCYPLLMHVCGPPTCRYIVGSKFHSWVKASVFLLKGEVYYIM